MDTAGGRRESKRRREEESHEVSRLVPVTVITSECKTNSIEKSVNSMYKCNVHKAKFWNMLYEAKATE